MSMSEAASKTLAIRCDRVSPQSIPALAWRQTGIHYAMQLHGQNALQPLRPAARIHATCIQASTFPMILCWPATCVVPLCRGKQNAVERVTDVRPHLSLRMHIGRMPWVAFTNGGENPQCRDILRSRYPIPRADGSQKLQTSICRVVRPPCGKTLLRRSIRMPAGTQRITR